MAMHLGDLVRSGTAVTGRRLTQLYREVASELGNTGTVTRNSYVNPQVVDLAIEGLVIDAVRKQRHELVPLPASRAVFRLLQSQTP